MSNLGPSFDAELISNIEIEVTQDESGELDDSSVFEYVSPAATDPEGDAIVMSFSGLEEVAFAATQTNGDGSFTLRIDRALITETGSFTLGVSLGDEVEADTSSFSISIEVIFNGKAEDEETEAELDLSTYDYYESESVDDTLDSGNSTNSTEPEELTTEQKLEKIAKDK